MRSWNVARDRTRAQGRQFDVIGYAKGTRTVRLHRLIWRLMGRPEVPAIDHIDRNPLNNAEDNLRDGKGINSRNRGRQKNNTSGFKGVS